MKTILLKLFFWAFVPLFLIHSPQAAQGSIEKIKEEHFDKIVEIKKTINHERSFKEDDKNFMKGLRFAKGKTKRPYTVFINMHDGSLAQTSPIWTPEVKRTFQWEVPYEQALRQAMSALHHSHKQSALLTSWTGGKIRQYISFVIIPKDTEMEFKIGYAAPQSGVSESQPGGGMQVRLKYLPEKTIILTEKFPSTKNTYSISNLFEKAIKDYNNTPSNHKLPETIVHDDLTFTNEEEYIQETIQ